MSAPTGTVTDPIVPPAATVDDDSGLGDAGKRAIERMKAERNEDRAALKAALAQIEALKPKAVEPVKDEAKPGDLPDVAGLVKAETDKIRAEAIAEKAADKLEAKATKLLADPADAARYLKVADFVKDGVVDLAAMDAALEALVKSKPYLKAEGARPKFEGGADGGAKENAGKVQLTLADVATLEKQGAKGALAIEAARLAGQLDVVLGIKK